MVLREDPATPKATKVKILRPHTAGRVANNRLREKELACAGSLVKSGPNSKYFLQNQQ